MRAQKVVITLTDKPGGKVACNLEFIPAVKGSAKTTPAALMAFEMIEAMASKNPITKAEVKP